MENELIVQDELINSVRNILSKEKMNKDNSFSFYEYNGVRVPRVTAILSKTINKPGLINWAANLGRKNMYIEKKKATTIGTKVHSLIEDFLINGTYKREDMDFSDIQYMTDIDTSLIAFDNFKAWYENLTNNGYNINVIATECVVITPFFGGTIDCIAEINGAVYIIDWKTSKQISPEYFIQTAAYMWAINNGYGPIPHVDGIGIVRLSKTGFGYTDSFLTYQSIEHARFIDDYLRAFGSLLQSYYNLIHIEKFNHNYNLYDILGEINND